MLTAQQVKGLQCPQDKKQIKRHDTMGLFILVKSNGSKLWRFRYKFAKKHQELALGKYPTISLSKARKLAENARIQLSFGVNPMEERRCRKNDNYIQDKSFGVVAIKWWDQKKDSWSLDHAAKVRRWLTRDAASLSKRHIDKIDSAHITDLMLEIEASGSPKNAPVILSVLNRIFGYAQAHRLTRNNPAQGLPLGDIIKPLPRVKHRAAIVKPDLLGKLIKDIDESETGSFCTNQALKLIPRVFLRPREVRNLRWEFVDFNDKLIRIPEKEMKKHREHLVPLSEYVIEQLSLVKQVTGYSPYVFPSSKNSDKPISKNVLTNRLRALGYEADIMSAHGFRSSASTILHEQGWPHFVIEAQLAHLTGTATSRAYNRSIYLQERRAMMEKWSDYLEVLKQENDL